MITKQQNQNRERGNALFLILIAVALFAALSYAVTQSGRGGGTVDRETASITGGQATQYAAALRTAVTRMILTGTAANTLTYDNTALVGVFAPDGGGQTNQTPPSGIGAITRGGLLGATAGAWGYKNTVAATGFYILGVGTDTLGTGRDHIAYLESVTDANCRAINRGLGLGGAAPVNQAVAFDPTVGTGLGLAAAGAAGQAHTFSAISGQAFACTQQAGGVFDYYHALVEN